MVHMKRTSLLLKPNPVYPVTSVLADIFQPAKVRRGGKDPPPTSNEIVSEGLCDDVINYLAPTLEKHKGCTIIDVHPGACLWSRKLHEILKPRRHLLMEPDKRFYEPFIKPLLDQPGSVYRHTPLAGAHPTGYWANYRTIMADSELVPRSDPPDVDSLNNQLDPGLLLIGNMTRRYKVWQRTHSVDPASMLLQQMAWAASSRQLVHTRGLVRMLWWAGESEKQNLFQPTESSRRTTSISMSFGVDTNEVVGCKNTLEQRVIGDRNWRVRCDRLLALNASRTRTSMQKLGMQLPENRKLLYDEPQVSIDNVVSPLQSNCSSISDLEEAIARTYKDVDKIRSLSGRIKPNRTKEDRKNTKVEYISTLEFPQLFDAAERLASTRGDLKRVPVLLADVELKIVRLEVAWHELREQQKASPEDLNRLRDEILKLNDTYDEVMASKAYRSLDQAINLVDEQIALFMEPPLIMVERKAYPTLKAEKDEFWPPAPMMLLDVTPTDRDLSVPDLADAAEATKVCRMLMTALFTARRSTVGEMLDRIAWNAAHDLIPQVPALSDPRKGGRLNPKKVRVRMLSNEAFEGLTKAFIEWPFRPSTLELELAADSEGVSHNEQSEASLSGEG